MQSNGDIADAIEDAADAIEDARTLLGTWDFTRSIDDRASHVHGRAAGRARFRLGDDDAIVWTESGTLHWTGSAIAIQRTLLLHRGNAGGWEVLFQDGAQFHPWRTGRTLIHPCVADLYEGRMEAGPGTTDSWSIEWTVRGPHKDYTLATTYRRADVQNGAAPAGGFAIPV